VIPMDDVHYALEGDELKATRDQIRQSKKDQVG
jgi:hypothetical protein